jgi:4-amino-4-deoxy-L-arabinose transferase-like glycosyltransferase
VWRVGESPAPSRLEVVALLLVLLLAGVLRFGWVGVSSFAGDEARISLDALRLTRGGEFIYIAQPSSTGVPFLPASVWMFAPPYLFSPDPLVATLYVCLISLLTVVGVWWLARGWGAWVGIAAALFLAASPYAVFYGRSIWQPNLLPALSLLWAWTAWRASRTPHGAAIALAAHCFLAGFIVQVHFAGVALALGSALLFVRLRWWRRLTPVLVGGGLALLCTLPYVYYLTTQDTQVLQRLGEVGGAAAVYDLSALANLVRLAVGYDWGYLALGELDSFSRQPLTALVAALLLLAGLAVLGRTLFGKTAEPPARIFAFILLVWLLASPLFFLRHTTPVLPHYQLVALPAAALLIGLATRLFAQQAWRWTVTGAVLLVVAVWTTQISASLERAAGERPPQSALSSILNESREAAAALSPERVALFFTHGDDAAISGEVAVFRVLLWEHPDARIINGEPTLILPNAPATLMTTLAPFQAWEELESGGLAGDAREYPRRAPVLPFMAADYDGVTLPQGFTPVEAVALADGAVLLGWRTRWVGERFRLSTLWRMEGVPPAEAMQQFHHLYAGDADAAPTYVSDVPLSMQNWRAGDHVVVMADFIDIPPATYALIIGHYRLADGGRIVSADGGDALPIGDVRVPPNG